MQTSQLSLRDLEYLIAVSEELHFGKAAQKLHVSQPTLSEQIKKLEGTLELKIFERTNRSVQLTAQGQELIDIAYRVIREANHFIKIAQQKKSPLSGEFHIGAIATVGPYYFPYIIGPLKKAFPQLELIIHEGMTDDLLDMLDRGELNAVIASRTFDEKNFRVYPLYKEPFHLACGQDYEIKTKNGMVSVKDIDEDKLLLLTEGNCLKDEVQNFCKLSRNRNSSKVQSSSLETLRHLIAAGNGITLFPELAITEHKKLKGLVRYYPFIEKSAHREIALVTREQYPKPEEIRLLVQKLKEHLPL
jgi:LysR family transcriptional regulator, hydrogen peroxide-inducible genes activator